MKSIMNAWTFGGVRLSTFGHIVELNSYLDLPPKRGGNVFIPLQDGNTHVTKYFDSKVLSFGLEIVSDGVCDLETKLDNLKILLGSRSQQYLANPMFPGGERRALAEVVSPLGVTRGSDPRVAKIVIDFLLSEPFLRNTVSQTSWKTLAMAPGDEGPIPIINGTAALYINNLGSAEERKAIITITGTLTAAVRIEMMTSGGVATGFYVAYSNAHVITSPHFVLIDCGSYTAYEYHTYPTVIQNVLGDVSHAGSVSFMVLQPGINRLGVISTGAGGTVEIEFYPPYL